MRPRTQPWSRDKIYKEWVMYWTFQSQKSMHVWMCSRGEKNESGVKITRKLRIILYSSVECCLILESDKHHYNIDVLLFFFFRKCRYTVSLWLLNFFIPFRDGSFNILLNFFLKKGQLEIIPLKFGGNWIFHFKVLEFGFYPWSLEVFGFFTLTFKNLDFTP